MKGITEEPEVQKKKVEKEVEPVTPHKKVKIEKVDGVFPKQCRDCTLFIWNGVTSAGYCNFFPNRKSGLICTSKYNPGCRNGSVK